MARIVHVLTVPESLVFLRGQIAFMRELGHEIDVVTSPGPALAAFGAREGVAVHGVEMPRRITPFGDAASVARLVKLFRSLRPDLVHAHTPKGGLLGTMAARAAGVPARIYHMRGLPLVTARGPRRAILTTTERASCALATRVLAVSASLREEAVRLRLARASKIAVLASGSGNGVDCFGRFDPKRLDGQARASFRASVGVPEHAEVVAFVGRLVRDKGVVELAEAWRRLRARRPRAHLVLAGVWEERDAVPAETRAALERDARVHNLGFVDDAPRLYAGVDVVALPTYREGFPNVPLEAAAMGVPVVATRVLGCVDAVVDGVTGTLVAPGSASALEGALERYLASPELRADHGRAGRQRVEREFAPPRIWSALSDVYDELLPRARRGGARPPEPTLGARSA